MRQTGTQRALVAALAWGVALLLFFPILWMVLTSFKSEVAAIATPPQVLFAPTLESYAEVQSRAEYLRFAMNSIVVSLGGTLLGSFWSWRVIFVALALLGCLSLIGLLRST